MDAPKTAVFISMIADDATMNRILSIWRRLMHFLGKASAFILGIATVVVIYLLYFDTDPPFERIDSCWHQGVQVRIDTPENPCSHVIPSVVVMSRTGERQFIRVRYVTTKPKRDCPGWVQQEYYGPSGFRDSQTELRAAVPAEWDPHPSDPDKMVFTGQPVPVPRGLDPGRIRFKSVTFRYCNFLQEYMQRPIVRSGPDLFFTLIVVDDDGKKQ